MTLRLIARITIAVLISTALAVAATILGCAAAMPFQPNAAASNTASNTAQANPAVTVSLPTAPDQHGQLPPASTQPAQ